MLEITIRMESLIVLKRNGKTDSRLQTGWFRDFHEIQSFVVFPVQEILDTGPPFPVQGIPGVSLWFPVQDKQFWRSVLRFLYKEFQVSVSCFMCKKF